jgi:uncharacterized protein YodC (DUF2158 family)
MQEDFSEGEVVRLKSGGPDMTVMELKRHMKTNQNHWAECQWFDEKHQLKSETFLLTSLQKVEPISF